MFAGLGFADSKLRVLAAAPVDCQDDLAWRVVDVGDDIGDKGAQELLSSACSDAWSVPGGIEIRSKPDKIRRDDISIGGLGRCESCLTHLDAAQCCFPALLQLCRNQPIVWIAGGIAPFCQCGFISGLLKLQFDDALLFGLAFHAHSLGFECRLDRHRFNGAKKFFADSRLNADAAES